MKRTMSVAPGRPHKPRKFVLCFDGTGNKFHGNDSDSNILKIYRMLDRTADDQYHYYQRKQLHSGMAPSLTPSSPELETDTQSPCLMQPA